MSRFAQIVATLVLLIFTACAHAQYPTQKILVSYWSNGKRYMPYPISGSVNDKGIIQKNDDLTGKLNKINILAYAFMQVDKEGSVYFSRPTIDLSKHDLSTFCHSNSSICRDANSKVYLGNFDAFAKLNNKSHHLKKIVSIGGAGSQASFIHAINHPNQFINSLTTIIKYYKLDGVDLDFELYTLFNQNQATRYAQLIENLRHKLGSQYYISIEIPSDNETLHSIGRNNWITISNNAFVSVMGYEFHNYQYPPYITANDSNLYSDPNEPAIKNFYHISVNQAIKYLTYLGVPARKIILGCPAYFAAYGAVAPLNHGLYQPFNPKLTPKFNYGIGKGSYSDIPKLLKSGFSQYQILLNSKTSAIYAYNQKKQQWLSYENSRSIAEKANYVNNNHLAGMMLWNIKQDLPANNPNSLLSAARHYLLPAN